jgi:hypothetical protein
MWIPSLAIMAPSYDVIKPSPRRHRPLTGRNRRASIVSRSLLFRGGIMALDGMQRVFETHVKWLEDWRRQLEMLEAGGLKLHSKGPNDKDWVDETLARIDDLRKQNAMTEELDKQYRP